MRLIERGAVTIHRQVVPCGRVHSYIVRCGACGLEVESPGADMPNEGLAYLRGRELVVDRPTTGDRAGADGRPWLIVGGNDANGGNVPPFVRCGKCRRDRA